ncbi:MAG TPA: RNA-binding domain-containing protein [Kofleriaceae bacterium]|nr:RNA-binding domain-containing protein [Kofleriaceae bacterium]
MTDDELAQLVRSDESDRVERKESLSDRVFDRVKKAICAFANDLAGHRKPGVVVVGQRDDGTFAGLSVDDGLLTKLAGIRVESAFAPFPSIDVRKLTLDGHDVAVVIVHVSSSPPVRYDGRIYVRVGPTTRIATPEEEKRLSERRRTAHLPFDVQAVESARLEDLDLDRFRRDYLPNAVAPDILEENHREQLQQLAALRMVTPDGQPTVVGVLVLANDPLRFFPGAYVQFIRFDGMELSDPIVAQHRISGPLQQLLQRLDDLIEANIRTGLDVVGRATHVARPDYPIDALRQVTRNAVMHRAYDGTNAPVKLSWFHDRIEVQNPGGPFGQVTIEKFGQLGLTDYRNPHVAEALKVLGFVERFGVGLAIANKRMAANGNPPLEYEVESSHVLVRLKRGAS